MSGVHGPTSAREGETVTLSCRYDLGRDPIYSMKWYKDGGEVFRYTPTEKPESRAFPSPGMRIDVSFTGTYGLLR